MAPSRKDTTVLCHILNLRSTTGRPNPHLRNSLANIQQEASQLVSGGCLGAIAQLEIQAHPRGAAAQGKGQQPVLLDDMATAE